MNNRADRRASAKIARQAIKRAKSPVEAALLRAAAAFAVEDAVGELGPWLSDPQFETAWTRLADDLHDILEERYPAFLVEAYVEAGLAAVQGSDAAQALGTRLFLCPVAGPSDRLAAFAGDDGEIGRLEASLREFGVVPEAARCRVFPFVLPLAVFSPDAMSPARVRALHDHLCDAISGAAARDGLADLVGGRDPSGAGAEFGALVGIEWGPIPAREAAPSEDDLAAEDMTRVAAAQSWHDSYAAEIAGMTVGAPLDWPASAAWLAWETIRVPLEAALARRGMPGARPDAIHCATTDDGRRFVVSAVAGDVAVGPFSAPADLVWFDADAFFDRAEASAENVLEHGDEAGVLAPLLGAR